MLEHEKWHQAGFLIKIVNEPKTFRAKKVGLELGTTHVIQPAPGNYKNSIMSVWVKDNTGKLRELNFHEFMVLGVKQGRTRGVRT